MTLSTPATPQTSWRPVAMMTLATFVFNTTEYAPVALLSDIGQSFHMPVERVGLMITIYAWAVALISLPIMLLTRNIERRRLLRDIFWVFIVSHFLSAVAWNYPVLLVSRIGVALAHSAFWAINAALVVRVAPEHKKQQALALLATGTVLAMVLGIPLGRIVGNTFGWRITFSLIGTAAALTLQALLWLLPQLPSQNTGSLKSLPSLLKRPVLLVLFALTVLFITAHFTAFSYIEPFSAQIAGLSGPVVTLVLLVFGATGMLGSWLFNLFNARAPQGLMIATLAAMLLCLLLLPFMLQQWALLLLVGVWGAAIMCFGLLMQSRILAVASDATDLSMSLYSALYNLGIGGGALLGAMVVEHYGLRWVGLLGSLFASIGLLLFLWLKATTRGPR